MRAERTVLGVDDLRVVSCPREECMQRAAAKIWLKRRNTLVTDRETGSKHCTMKQQVPTMKMIVAHCYALTTGKGGQKERVVNISRCCSVRVSFAPSLVIPFKELQEGGGRGGASGESGKMALTMEVTNWRLECHGWCVVSTATHTVSDTHSHTVTHTHIMPAIWIRRHFFSVYHQSCVFMQRGEER